MAHSNTQEERDKSRDSFLDCRESTEGKGAKARRKRQRQTEDVTWGFQATPQVYYKYSPSKGASPDHQSGLPEAYGKQNMKETQGVQ